MSGDESAVLAEEQAALRRVATLVARGGPAEEVFTAVTEEVVRLLPVDFALLGRYDSEHAVTNVAASGQIVESIRVGRRMALGGKNVVTRVFETGRPARIDSYADASGPSGIAARGSGIRSAVGTPIVVEGRLWGMVSAGSLSARPLPARTEARLADFTELLATAIANAESRAGLARLLEEQAALRRVATLVARGALPAEVFAAVTEEVIRLLAVDFALMARFESDGRLTTVAASGQTDGLRFPVGHAFAPGGKNLGAIIAQTGRSARIDSYADCSGPSGVAGRESGIRSAVGTPIIVEGHLWGLVAAGSLVDQPLPADTEERLAQFTELLATAIANAEGRAALAASRARIVAAADEMRRRIERDLHDGIQQRLVSVGLELRAVLATVPPQLGELEGALARVAAGLTSAFDELREISRGIHPGMLSEGGLEPALRALCRRSAVPVELDLHAVERLPEGVEVAAYYVVSEALTNAAKHARASVVNVHVDTPDEILRLAISDDGVGGADLSHGSGLVGLSDRIEALGGTLHVTSPAGSGTTLLIEIPLAGETRAASPQPSSDADVA